MTADLTGTLFDIQRGCVDDGPGLRTAVFFKGCDLRCAWCHNPESFSPRPQLLYQPGKCAGCGACVKVCPANAHTFCEGRRRVAFEACQACGACADVCPAGALRIAGRQWTVDEVLNEILRDERYYRSSGGGVTFSGGEPTLQPGFLAALLRACKERGIHTAVETNGLWNPRVMEPLLADLDLFLLDFKHFDCSEHRRFTGSGNERLLENLSFLNERRKRVILRCPIIPGVNDREAHFAAIARTERLYPCIEGVEVMPYHSAGASKWEETGRAYPFAGLKSAPPSLKRDWEARIAALSSGRDADCASRSVLNPPAAASSIRDASRLPQDGRTN